MAHFVMVKHANLTRLVALIRFAATTTATLFGKFQLEFVIFKELSHYQIAANLESSESSAGT
jgi:hypothetical protein